jgi:hypothetical protein
MQPTTGEVQNGLTPCLSLLAIAMPLPYASAINYDLVYVTQ